MNTRSALARGFTAIEMMVVIAVLAVITGLSAGDFRRFLAEQRARGLAMDLTADLLTARSESLLRNTSVTVQPRTGTDWTSGWTVSTSSLVLRERGASPGTLAISGAPSSIVFNAQGRPSSPTTAVRLGVSSGWPSARKRCIELDLSGRARSSLELTC